MDNFKTGRRLKTKRVQKKKNVGTLFSSNFSIWKQLLQNHSFKKYVHLY